MSLPDKHPEPSAPDPPPPSYESLLANQLVEGSSDDTVKQQNYGNRQHFNAREGGARHDNHRTNSSQDWQQYDERLWDRVNIQNKIPSQENYRPRHHGGEQRDRSPNFQGSRIQQHGGEQRDRSSNFQGSRPQHHGGPHQQNHSPQQQHDASEQHFVAPQQQYGGPQQQLGGSFVPVTNQPQIVNVNLQVTPMVNANNPVISQRPVEMTCPSCNTQITTEITFVTGSCTWLWCAVLCFSGLFLCFLPLLPFLTDFSKDVVHTCPNCKAECGRFIRQKNSDISTRRGYRYQY